MRTSTELRIRYLLVQIDYMNILLRNDPTVSSGSDYQKGYRLFVEEIDALFARGETEELSEHVGPETEAEAATFRYIPIGEINMTAADTGNFVEDEALANAAFDETNRIYWPADSLRSEQEDAFYPPDARFLSEDDAIEHMAPTGRTAAAFRRLEARSFLSDEGVKGTLQSFRNVSHIEWELHEPTVLDNPELLTSDALSVWSFGENLTVTDPEKRTRIRAFIRTGDPLDK